MTGLPTAARRRTVRTTRSRATRAIRVTKTATPPPRRTWAGFLTAFLLGLAVAFLVTSWNGPDATERRIAELEQEEAARDTALLGPLTDQARQTRDGLAPVLAAMASAAPVDGSAGAALTPEAVAGWRDTVAAAEKAYEQSPSAGNGINIARTGLRTAVQQLAAAVRTFEAALAPGRSDLVALAGEQRTLALRTWSVAAIQLDVINIEAGRGHVHVQLSGAGAPDSTPEGQG